MFGKYHKTKIKEAGRFKEGSYTGQITDENTNNIGWSAVDENIQISRQFTTHCDILSSTTLVQPFAFVSFSCI